MSAWTIEEGIKAARLFEPVAIKHGFHIALGGSVLHKGKSEKDLDLFFYVHNTSQPFNKDNLMAALEAVGISELQERPHTQYGDDKLVFSFNFFGKRIDLFFLITTPNKK